jgi:hypothetical protein
LFALLIERLVLSQAALISPLSFLDAHAIGAAVGEIGADDPFKVLTRVDEARVILDGYIKRVG